MELVAFARIVPAAALLSLLVACTPWKEVRPSGGGFAVQMPDPHPCNRSRGPSEFGALSGWQCTSDDGAAFSKQFGIYSASSFAIPAGQDLEPVKRSVAHDVSPENLEVGTNLIASRERSLGGAVWSESVLEGGESRRRWRATHLVTVRSGGVFRLVVTGPLDAWPSRQADRFFASFRFVGEPGDASPPGRR